MPLRDDGTLYCPTHTNRDLARQGGTFAVTKVELPVGFVLGASTERPRFKPNEGLPLTVFVCPACGYAEFYVKSLPNSPFFPG